MKSMTGGESKKVEGCVIAERRHVFETVWCLTHDRPHRRCISGMPSTDPEGEAHDGAHAKATHEALRRERHRE